MTCKKIYFIKRLKIANNSETCGFGVWHIHSPLNKHFRPSKSGFKIYKVIMAGIWYSNIVETSLMLKMEWTSFLGVCPKAREKVRR